MHSFVKLKKLFLLREKWISLIVLTIMKKDKNHFDKDSFSAQF